MLGTIGVGLLLSAAIVCYNYKQAIGEMATILISRKVTETHHKHFVISYPHGTHWYKIVVPRERRPFVLCSVMDENEKDVTRKN